MNSKKILIIEDREKQRRALHEALEMRGFQVYSAGKVGAARRLIAELRSELDVMILDMRLEDRDHPEITGADLGLEVSKRQSEWPPEFLIHSAYSEVSYYELALRLRVAAYLYKETYKQDQLIQHIRALALRRALSVERPDLARRIEQIGESSRTQTEAVKQFCQEVLIPELNACLGSPFILLLSEKEQTISCGGNAGLPEGANPIYDMIQALVYAESVGKQSFTFNVAKIPPSNLDKGHPIVKRLDGGAFISLSLSNALPLTLGVLKADKGDFPLAENPVEMVQALINYLKPAVLEQFLRLSSYWAENNAKRDARLTETSRIFLYIGQEQLSILQDARDSGEWVSESVYFQQLQSLAADLYDTGQVLSSVRTKKTETLHSEEIAEFARTVWKEIGDTNIQNALKISGSCAVQASAEDLFIILSRILQWFTQRFIEYPPDAKTEVFIHCSTSDKGPMIVLEDRSRRLSSSLRKRLFDTFTQANPVPAERSSLNRPGVYLPLYLAKALVEEKYNGRLEDRSDQIDGELGHRFVLRFRPVERAAARRAP